MVAILAVAAMSPGARRQGPGRGARGARARQRLQPRTVQPRARGHREDGGGGFALLASATLAVHERADELTALTLGGKPAAVRWIKVRLSGVLVELRQEGATVTGCYDTDGGELHGTVSGNVLRAVGVDPGDKVKSSFILAVGGDGGLRGLRSTNGAPFRPYQGPVAPAGTRTKCSAPPPRLGCGAVIHAINFDFDSALIRSESEPVLKQLHAGLAGERTASIVIEGHTSSEGAAAHNLDLSRRRAQAVVDDLVARGLDRKRIRATGKGSAAPIAPNTDEAGRSLNRRVEVQCT